MLIGRKLFDYYNAKKKLVEIDRSLDNLTKEINNFDFEEKKLQNIVTELQGKTQDEETMINLALAKQGLIMHQKERDRKEPNVMEENFSLMQKKVECEKTIWDIEKYVTEEVWKEYKRIQENVENPVVQVKHQMCTGCFIPLSKSNLDKWRMGKELVKCDVCGRILA